MIEVKNLSKVFIDRKRGEINAVNNVSLQCNSGEIFGLLGPNGAGKTTILRMLSTVLHPTSGSATVAGYDIEKDAQEVRKQIGFLSGNTGIYEKLTPTEMVRYFGRLYGMSNAEIQQRSEEIFKLFQMEDFADMVNSKLSSGMRQKVSIARTIIHDPPVLIFDEPTINLDILVAKSVVDFMARCREENKCVILSTHILSEVEKLCDRIAIIHHGKIIIQGTTEEILESTQAKNLEEAFFQLVLQTEGEQNEI